MSGFQLVGFLIPTVRTLINIVFAVRSIKKYSSIRSESIGSHNSEKLTSQATQFFHRLIRCVQGNSKLKNFVPSKNFGSLLPDHLKVSVVLDSVWKNNDLIFFVAYIRGLRSIHQLGLAKVDEILPSPLIFLEKLR